MARQINVATAPDRPAVGLLAVAIFAAVTSAVALALTMSSPTLDPTATAITVYGSLMFTFVGVVVLWRRPRHGIGRLALLIGILFSLSAAIRSGLEWWQPGAGARAVLFGPLKSFYEAADSLSTLLSVAGLILGVVLLITWFPDGRRTSRLGGIVELALVGGVVAVAVGTLREPILRQVGWSRGLDDALLALLPVAVVLFAGAWIGSVVDLAMRYRGSDAIRRTQMRWVLVASAVSATALVSVLGLGEWVAGIWYFGMISLGLPVLAVAVAITRYHLYDIDRIVSQSISYAIITAVLFGVFAAVNLVVTQSVTSVLPEDARTVAVALSTLVVASLFQPLRRRVQLVVDRRFHRSHYDAQRTVDGFAARLRGDVDLAGLGRALQIAAVDTVEPVSTAVWLRPGGTS